MTGEQAYRDIVFASADQRLQLYARDYASSAEADREPALLMMHGLTRNSADFEPLIALLSERFRMIVPDQRGRGRSDYDPDPSQYRPDIYVEDMWRLLDQLDIEQVICIGTSMGGLMSMVMAAQQPDRVAGIVLNDIGPQVSKEGLDRIRSYVGVGDPVADWDEAARMCRSINAEALDGLGPQEWLEFAHRTCTRGPDGLIRFAYDPNIAASMAEEDPATIPPDLWSAWETLDAKPVLALRGERSDILTAETLAQMERRHSGPFDGIEVAGRGHAPLLNEPEAAKAIATFLDQNA